jgi:hypothetical protein
MILSLLLAAATMGHPSVNSVPQVECRVERVEVGVPLPGQERAFRTARKGWTFEAKLTWATQ